MKCASNLRQIAQGLMLYANDHGGQYPPTLDLLISELNIHPEVFCCPSTNSEPAIGTNAQQRAKAFASNPDDCDYVYLGATLNSGTPARWIVAYEKNLHPTAPNATVHGMNFMFNDGHVEFFEEPQASKMVAELQAGQNPPPSASP